MKWLRWTKGRNGSYAKPYMIMLLIPMWICKRFNIDLFLIKMEKGSCIHTHLDNERNFKGWNCWRTNIILKHAKKGGSFRTYTHAYSSLVKMGTVCTRLYYSFRPDAVPHSVSPVIDGTRWSLSFGNYTKSECRIDISKGPYMARSTIFRYHGILQQCIDACQTKTMISVDPWSPFFTKRSVTNSSSAKQLLAEEMFMKKPDMTIEECYIYIEESIE